MNARSMQHGASSGAADSTYNEVPFEFSAPVAGLSAATMTAHVDLYRGYLAQANELVDAVRDAAGSQDKQPPAHNREMLARRLAFETNGVLLHECFFEQLAAKARDAVAKRGSALAEAFDAAFGGYDAWKNDIKQLGETRGIGWIATFWDPSAEYLTNTWIDLHHLSVPVGQRIVFVIDLWEHAYWTDYGAKGRGKYVEAVTGALDWSVLERRLES